MKAITDKINALKSKKRELGQPKLSKRIDVEKIKKLNEEIDKLYERYIQEGGSK